MNLCFFTADKDCNRFKITLDLCGPSIWPLVLRILFKITWLFLPIYRITSYITISTKILNPVLNFWNLSFLSLFSDSDSRLFFCNIFFYQVHNCIAWCKSIMDGQFKVSMVCTISQHVPFIQCPICPICPIWYRYKISAWFLLPFNTIIGQNFLSDMTDNLVEPDSHSAIILRQ